MESTTSIFTPSSNSLLIDYPSLKKHEEFTRLKELELMFVWYYACKSSPIYGWKEKKKPLEAIKRVPGFLETLNEEEYARYISRDFPTDIDAAIGVMKKFEPEFRNNLNTYTKRILDYVDFVTSLKITDYMSDTSKIKNFMDMQINIAKNLPEILEGVEHGYGTKKAKNKEESKNIFPED